MLPTSPRTSTNFPPRKQSSSSGHSYRSRRESLLSDSSEPPVRGSAQFSIPMSPVPASLPYLEPRSVPQSMQHDSAYQSLTRDMERQSRPPARRVLPPLDMPIPAIRETLGEQSYVNFGTATVSEAMNISPSGYGYGNEIIMRHASDIQREKKWYKFYRAITSPFRRLAQLVRRKKGSDRSPKGRSGLSTAPSSGWHFRDNTPLPPPIPSGLFEFQQGQDLAWGAYGSTEAHRRSASVGSRRETDAATDSSRNHGASHLSRHTAGTRSHRSRTSFRTDSFPSRRSAHARGEPLMPPPPVPEILTPVPVQASTRASFAMPTPSMPVPSIPPASARTTGAVQGSQPKENSRRSSRFSFASSKGESLAKLAMQFYRGLIALYNLPWIASPPKRVAVDFIPAMSSRSRHRYRRSRASLPPNVVEAAKEAREMLPSEGKSWYRPSPEQLLKQRENACPHKNQYCMHPPPNQQGDGISRTICPTYPFPQPQYYNWGSTDANHSQPPVFFITPASPSTGPNIIGAQYPPQNLPYGAQFITMPQPVFYAPGQQQPRASSSQPPPGVHPPPGLAVGHRPPSMRPQTSVSNNISPQPQRPSPRTAQQSSPSGSGLGSGNSNQGQGQEGTTGATANLNPSVAAERRGEASRAPPSQTSPQNGGYILYSGSQVTAQPANYAVPMYQQAPSWANPPRF